MSDEWRCFSNKVAYKDNLIKFQAHQQYIRLKKVLLMPIQCSLFERVTERLYALVMLCLERFLDRECIFIQAHFYSMISSLPLQCKNSEMSLFLLFPVLSLCKSVLLV